MNHSYFKQGPQDVSADFVKPTSAFKRKVIFALLGLLVFFLIYFGLMIWFAKESLNSFAYARRDNVDNKLFLIIAGVCLMVLSVFMLKSLIWFKKRSKNPYREVKPEEEPELVSFIHQVADEIGAPKPKKIYLSDRVNASVSYDLSLLNILFPSKKNLEIGLGLVNVMNLTEFKAILAHEFGHFAQRSMLLGRYVYVAQQIAERIIYKRDALDKGLSLFSSIDIRISWIGWILQIIVWAIRSFISVIFGIVAVSELALSREMEYQADKVAVSVTGSDPLIFGLHKLQAADQGYQASIGILEKLLRDKKTVENLFVLQKYYIEQMRIVLDDPDFGKEPADAKPDENYRVFKTGHVNPPQMWSTHPADIDRENNAKEYYIRAEIDERSATLLFTDIDKLNREVTERLIKLAEVEVEERLSDAEAIQYMHREYFAWNAYAKEYKGVYLNRAVFSNVQEVSEIYDVSISGNLQREIQELYPEDIKEKLESHRELVEEINALKAARNEIVTGEKRRIMHRGKQIRRRDIPELIESLKSEEQQLHKELVAHDKRCRTVYYKAAEELDIRVAGYHKSLVGTLLFAEHSMNGLNVYNNLLQHTLYVASADGRISQDEITEIINAGNALFKVMRKASTGLENLELSKVMQDRLGVEKATELMEEFTFTSPDHHNIESWVNNYGGWFVVVREAIQKLYNHTLDHLLELESTIKDAYLNQSSIKEPFVSFGFPVEFERLVPGTEKEPHLKLSFWDKFQAGIGLFPTIARFTAAGGIIALALFFSYYRPDSTLFIHNGLDRDVVVTIGSEEYFLAGNTDLQVQFSGRKDIVTKTTNGQLIESFEPEISHEFEKYVYNIASASFMYTYTAVYQSTMSESFSEPEHENLGPIRWIPTNADFVLEDAPEQLYVEHNNSRKVLIALDDVFAPSLPYSEDQLDLFMKQCEVHLLWDKQKSNSLLQWTQAVKMTNKAKSLLSARAAKYPDEIETWRALMDVSSKREKQEMVTNFRKSFEKSNNPDELYLMYRAMEDSEERRNGFVEGNIKFPTHPWLGWAAGFELARMRNWKASRDAFAAFDNRDPNYQELCLTNYRVERMVAYETGEEPDAGYCGDAQNFERMESTSISALTGFDRFLSHLSYGEIEQAKLLIDKFDKVDQPFLEVMIAASSGCDQDFIDRVMVGIENKVNASNIAIVIGLCAKEGVSTEELLKQYGEINNFQESELQAAKTFMDLISKKDIAGADKVLEKFQYFTDRTNLELIGCMVLGTSAPKEWLVEVKNILLPNERPYL